MQKDVKLSYQCCMFYVAIITQYTEEDNIQKLNQIKIFFIQLKCRKFFIAFYNNNNYVNSILPKYFWKDISPTVEGLTVST